MGIKIFVCCDETTGRIKNFHARFPPAGETAIPFPVNIEKLKLQWFDSGENVQSKHPDWKVFAKIVPKKGVVFVLVDKNQESRELPHAHFCDAVFFPDYDAHDQAVKEFEESFLAHKPSYIFFDEFKSRLVKDGFIDKEQGALIDKILDISFNFWMNAVSIQKGHLFLAKSDMKFCLERLALAKIKLAELTEVNAKILDMINVHSACIQGFTNDLPDNFDISVYEQKAGVFNRLCESAYKEVISLLLRKRQKDLEQLELHLWKKPFAIMQCRMKEALVQNLNKEIAEIKQKYDL